MKKVITVADLVNLPTFPLTPALKAFELSVLDQPGDDVESDDLEDLGTIRVSVYRGKLQTHKGKRSKIPRPPTTNLEPLRAIVGQTEVCHVVPASHRLSAVRT